MFRRFRVFIINQFGFSKKEANGVILLFIISMLTALVLHVPMPEEEVSRNNDAQELKAWVSEIENSIQTNKPEERIIELAEFDPNLATMEELNQLGFEEQISQRIVNYRDAGGRFRKPSDLDRIYGINKNFLEQIVPFIRIPPISEGIEENNRPSSSYELAEKPTKEVVKIDLNYASAEDLQQVRGIGPILSERTIKYRQMLGGFKDFNQLTEVYGLSDSLLTQFENLFLIDTAFLTKISINTDSIRHLSKHPYIDYNLARAIVNYRQTNGTYTNLEDLLEIKIMTDSLYHKLYFYLSIGH